MAQQNVTHVMRKGYKLCLSIGLLLVTGSCSAGHPVLLLL
jgi:hypothetical protein